jgi:hypothetical protein
VLGHQLEIAGGAHPVFGLVFDADVGEMDVSGSEGEFVTVRECAARVRSVDAVLLPFVHVGVVLRLEFGIEDDVRDRGAIGLKLPALRLE